MSWFYVKDGRAAGPVPEEALTSQLRAGAISASTLVWRTGLKEWLPLSVAAPQALYTPTSGPSFPTPPAALFPAGSAPPEIRTGPPPVLPVFFCTQCGQIIPADQLVRIGERAVCAACKPAFVQHVSEGVTVPVRQPVVRGVLPGIVFAPETDLADPGTRLVAHLLDLLFLFAAIMVIFFLFGMIAASTGIYFRKGAVSPSAAGTIGLGLFVLIGLTVAGTFGYWSIFIGRNGATPGMKIMKVKMVRSSRAPVGYGRALGRALVFYFLNAFTFHLTNLTAFADAERRTFVDMIFDTRVIKNPS